MWSKDGFACRPQLGNSRCWARAPSASQSSSSCEYCDFKRGRSWNLMKHKISEHWAEISCENCYSNQRRHKGKFLKQMINKYSAESYSAKYAPLLIFITLHFVCEKCQSKRETWNKFKKNNSNMMVDLFAEFSSMLCDSK